MDLSDYLRILRQRGWVIVLVALLTAAATFGFSKVQTPVYESTLRMLVRPSRTDFGQSQAAKELLASYVAWLNSRYRAQYGLLPTAELQWSTIAEAAKRCDECGHCEERCPARLRIIPSIHEAAR